MFCKWISTPGSSSSFASISSWMPFYLNCCCLRYPLDHSSLYNRWRIRKFYHDQFIRQILNFVPPWCVIASFYNRDIDRPSNWLRRSSESRQTWYTTFFFVSSPDEILGISVRHLLDNAAASLFDSKVARPSGLISSFASEMNVKSTFVCLSETSSLLCLKSLCPVCLAQQPDLPDQKKELLVTIQY